MKRVQPIRSREQLARMLELAAAHDAEKESRVSWELLLTFGFNTGLRISDIVKLRVGEVRDQEYVQTVAQKTGKDTKIWLNKATQRKIRQITRGRGDREYLFQSREKDSETLGPRHICRQRAYQIINGLARAAGIQDRIGCHTLRKTFAYHYYKQTQDVVKLQRILGHDSRRDTLTYIGILDDEVDKSLMRFEPIVRK